MIFCWLNQELNSYGDRAFSKPALFLWNPLPIAICTSQTLTCFKQRLKTYELIYNITNCYDKDLKHMNSYKTLPIVMTKT